MADNNSNALLDGLKTLNTGLSYINPYQWLGRMSAANTDYVDNALNEGSDAYSSSGYMLPSLADRFFQTAPQIVKEEQNKQIRRYVRENEIDTKAEDYDIDLKNNGQYRQLDKITKQVARGDRRSEALSDKGLISSDLQLPDGTNFASIQKPLFQRLLREAAARRDTNTSLINEGIDPSTVSGRAAANEAIRKKKTADEIESATAISKAADEAKYGTLDDDGNRVGGSTPGRMEIDTHDDGLKTNQETRRINRNSDDRATQQLNQNITQQNYTNKRDAYEFDKKLEQLAAEREYNLAVRKADHAANVKTINLQNSADRQHYELMLQNDREVRQGDDISDLVASLTMLNGVFLL